MLRLLAPTAVLAIALLFASCGNDPTPLEPIEPSTDAGLALVGTVYDADGAPVDGARVVLEPVVDGTTARVAAALDGDRPALARAATDGRIVLTGDDGRFRFDEVASGPHLLTTDARDHLGAVTNVMIPDLAAAAVETVTVDVQLTPTGSIEGTVALENTTNLQGTVVYVAGTSYVSLTDASGAFAITGVPVGSRTVVAARDDYLEQQATAELLTAGQVVTLPPFSLLLDTNVPPQAAPAPQFTATGQGNIFRDTRLVPNAEDGDGTIVLWEWDFDNDGVFDWADSTTGEADFLYDTVGTKRAKLRVTDDDGARTLALTEPFEIVDGIFVSAANGNDGAPGTRTQPVATIATGMAIAASQGRPLVVASGNYSSFNPVEGIDVFGGFDESTWTSTRNNSVVAVPSTGIAFDTIEAARYRRLEFVAADATSPGSASIAAILLNCGPNLEFDDCVFRAGDGADGAPGAFGTNGTPGGAGNPGSTGLGSGGAGGFTPGDSGLSQGGGGGAGTRFVTVILDPSYWSVARAGSNGDAGGSGAVGGTGGSVNAGAGCQNGNPGFDGEWGDSGSNGAGTPNPLGFVEPFFSTWNADFGANGTPGNDAAGGGGGGAGGNTQNACQVEGPGGGGGGGGGRGGTEGEGGQGGGASIAVLSLNSQARLTDCELITTNGGNGGNGGDSGLGGNGGAGGLGATASGLVAGNGGDGGRGGDGGGGQGGPGGSVIGVAYTVTAPVLENPIYTQGRIGSGGEGGLGVRFLLNARQRAAAGPNGQSLTITSLGTQ